MRMGNSFQINFNNPILPGLATIGKYDGKSSSLTCATTGNRIMMHSRRSHTGGEGQGGQEQVISFLNFSQQPVALETGRLQSNTGDTLFIGSATTVNAYNVENNTDAFYKEVGDGVNCLAFGSMHRGGGGVVKSPLLFAGGNCSIVGFGADGSEDYWTVTGDNVSALGLIEWSADKTVLAAGSEDFDVRFFDKEEVLQTLTESDKVSQLVPCPGTIGRYAFLLPNGTVGVNNRADRSWRVKGKHKPSGLAYCDVDFDGVPELLCGWGNGRFEVRRDGTGVGGKGEILFKDSFGSAISSVLAADYRQDQRKSALVCSYDGVATGLVALEVSVDEAVESKEKFLLDSLLQQRQSLASELKTIETQLETQQQSSSGDNVLRGGGAQMPSLGTTISCRLRPNADSRSIDLALTSSEGVVRSAIVTGEHVFDRNESAFFSAAEPTNILMCGLRPEKDVPCDVSVAVMVAASPIDQCFQVHDLLVKLPKFAMYVPVKELARQPQGYAIARMSERPSRFNQWLSNSFSVPPQTDNSQFAANFVCVRNGQCVSLSSSPTNGGEFVVRCDSIEICGDMIQDAAEFLGITEVSTTAEFPQEFAVFQGVLQKVDEYNTARMKLSAEMADSSQLVKALVIKAEDARILSDIRAMKRTYGSLFDLNRELLGEYMKRSNNHNELLAALKDVNSMIQRAGKLRVGQSKTSLVAACRNAIKNNNVHMLFSIIRQGSES
jgi:Bardet-Biedl syndrome 2 protein